MNTPDLITRLDERIADLAEQRRRLEAARHELTRKPRGRPRKRPVNLSGSRTRFPELEAHLRVRREMA